MKLFYFSVFLLILSAVFGSTVYFGQEFSKIYSDSFSSRLQANLLTNKISEVLNQSKQDEKEINVVFVGDIMLDRGVEQVFEKYDNSRYPFLKVVDEISKADIAFANLEGSISERGTNHKIKYSFRFNPSVIEGLKFAGFDVLSLANNHSFDWGREALEDTIKILKENGISPVGAGMNYLEANKPVTTSDVDNIKIAFLAYENIEPNSKYDEANKDLAGKSSFDLERIKNEIQATKELKVADIIIVSTHWGEEYQLRSNKNQQETGRTLIEAGADLIVGHHPHVVQEIERYKNGWIAYSLGNFIFDQNFSDATMEGLMLKVKIQNKKIAELEPIEIKINDSFQLEIVEL